MSARPFPFNEYRIEGDVAILLLRRSRGPRKGQVVAETRIDAADLPALIEDGRPWYLHSAGYAYRAERQDGRVSGVMLHRALLNPAADQVVDHLNRDTLDNRRVNLRACSRSDNLGNTSVQPRNTLGMKNISPYPSRTHPYVVRIQRHNRLVLNCLCRTLNAARITASLARRHHYGADYQ